MRIRLESFVTVASGNVLQLALALQAALGRRQIGRPPDTLKRTARQQGRRIAKLTKRVRLLDKKYEDLEQRTGNRARCAALHWAVSAGLSDPNFGQTPARLPWKRGAVNSTAIERRRLSRTATYRHYGAHSGRSCSA